MIKVVLIILAFFLLGPGDGDKKGRRGNSQYRSEQYAEAEASYRDALLDVQQEGPGRVHAGLLNNLGASLFRQGNFEQALAAFSGSARMAPQNEDMVRATYNAGNAATMQEELETALDFYTQALLNDPTNEDAKFNYEFVKRKLQEQQEQQQQQQNQEQQNQDQQNQDQEQQNQNQDQDQQQEQQQQEPQENQQQQQQEQEQQERTNPEELTQEEAERLLQALENEEEQLLREIQKMNTRPKRVEKDW